jgi:acetyl esterase/lipase
MLATARFTREFLRPREPAVVAEEIHYDREGESFPATLYRPRRVDAPLPGWITLHGLTYHGRDHSSLKRLARALAAAGSVVMVPDIPEWRALRVAPDTAVRTIRAAVLRLDTMGVTEPGRIGVMGFSFGATQALIAATDPDLEGHLAGVVAWGGYAEMGRVSRFMFLGQHELDGQTHELEPDPYGRWVLFGNYASLLEESADGEDAGAVFLTLAREAGRQGLMSWDPALDPVKARLRAGLPPERRELFDLLAPPATAPVDPSILDRRRELVDRLLPVVLRREPLLDPSPFLGRVPVPVFLAHGRHDRLIPWTEMVRLQRALPPGIVATSAVTGLFAHSRGERRYLTPGVALEGVRFLALMRRMLRFI